MGRRKIEIQPITHERNRSVTFLKRKNGLFKKAYELGVLCSVDVAVIIFEERPGHETRMHQYSSTDIRDIVQRQLRHQGEKDIKTPGDFSGTGGSKFDADGEGDDDDEEDVPMRNTRSKPVTTKSSAPATQPTPSTDPEQAPAPPSRSVQPQPPLLRMDEQTGLSSLLPVSNDRVSSVRSSHTRGTLPNKRPRLSGEYHSSRSRSPSDEGEMNSYKTNGHDLYMGERGPPTRYDDRALRNLGHLGSQLQLSTPYTSSDSLYPTQQQQVYGSSQYADPFSGHASGSSGSSSAAGFLPMNGQDFSQPRGGGGPMSREFGTEYDHGMQSRRYVVGSTYDSPMYSGLLRTTSTSMGPPQQPPPSAQGGGGYGRSGGGGGYLGREDRTDSFSALLEADERSRQQQETGSSDLIWPIHESRGTGGSASDGIGSVAGRTNSAPLSEDTPESNGAGGHWLDFLSSGGSKGGTRSSATTDIASIFGIGNGSGQREAEGSPEEKGDVPSIIVPDGADKEDRG